MKKLIALSFIYILAVGFSVGQSTTTINYDASGNRIAKKMQGSSPNPSVTASPQAVNPSQSTTLVSSGCTGTVKWSTGQTGVSITANPTVTTQYSASCVVANCPSNGIGKVTVDVIQCVFNEITTSASTALVQPTQPVLLSAYGCAGGTVNWSTGQTGEQITVTPIATTNYIATCTKPYCPNSGSASIGVTVNCVTDNVTVSVSSLSLFYGQYVNLNAYGCTGTIQWSTGQAGTNSISVQVYGSSSTFTATCNKPYCLNSGSSTVSIAGTASCAPGAVLVTAQAGSWITASTWTCGRIPTISDEVYLLHPVTINNNVTASAKTLILSGGYVINQGNGSLNLPTY